MTTIGDRIRRERRKQKLSQERLSRGICSQSSLSRLENNNVNLSVMKVNQILEKLDLSLDVLLANEETTRENVFRNELDAARDRNDHEEMARILDAHQDNIPESSELCKMYMKWHRGLLAHHAEVYDDAEKQFRYAIYIAETYKFESYMPHLYLAMGSTMHALGENPLKYYAVADKIYRRLETADFRLETRILYHLIVHYSDEMKYYRVILKCRKAINLLSRNFSSYMMCEIYVLYFQALAGLNKREEYFKLRLQTYIIFEQHGRLDLWEKSENYPTVNN